MFRNWKRSVSIQTQRLAHFDKSDTSNSTAQSKGKAVITKTRLISVQLVPIAALVMSAQIGHAQQFKVLLTVDKNEYGWSHSGVRSWGANWQIRAVNEASGQIRTSIERMVNLAELETYSRKDLQKKLDAEYSYPYSGKIAFSEGKSSEERMRWVNRNNLLVSVSKVRIKPGSAYTMTRNEFNRRSWDASATMYYKLTIMGKDTSSRSEDIEKQASERREQERQALHYPRIRLIKRVDEELEVTLRCQYWSTDQKRWVWGKRDLRCDSPRKFQKPFLLPYCGQSERANRPATDYLRTPKTHLKVVGKETGQVYVSRRDFKMARSDESVNGRIVNIYGEATPVDNERPPLAN